MKRRDFLAEHITKKDFTEDLMKSLAWTTLCGVSYAMSISAFTSAEYLQGAALFVVFLMLVVLSAIYVAVHVVIPLDLAMYPKDPYWDEKAESLSGVARFKELAKVYLARKGIVYLPLCLGYFLYGQEVAQYLAIKAVNG